MLSIHFLVYWRAAAAEPTLVSNWQILSICIWRCHPYPTRLYIYTTHARNWNFAIVAAAHALVTLAFAPQETIEFVHYTFLPPFVFVHCSVANCSHIDYLMCCSLFLSYLLFSVLHHLFTWNPLPAFLPPLVTQLITTFSPGLEERVREGVLAAFRDILSKEVILQVATQYDAYLLYDNHYEDL